MTRFNGDYKIIRSEKIEDNREVVIGYNPDLMFKYVCWYCINGDYYTSGEYSDNKEIILDTFLERYQI